MVRKVTEEMRKKHWGKRTAQQMAKMYPGTRGLSAAKDQAKSEAELRSLSKATL